MIPCTHMHQFLSSLSPALILSVCLLSPAYGCVVLTLSFSASLYLCISVLLSRAISSFQSLLPATSLFHSLPRLSCPLCMNTRVNTHTGTTKRRYLFFVSHSHRHLFDRVFLLYLNLVRSWRARSLSLSGKTLNNTNTLSHAGVQTHNRKPHSCMRCAVVCFMVLLPAVPLAQSQSPTTLFCVVLFSALTHDTCGVRGCVPVRQSPGCTPEHRQKEVCMKGNSRDCVSQREQTCHFSRARTKE